MRLPGYSMPAEWFPHRATWMAWPHRHADWPGKFAPIPWVYGEIVRILSRHERVCLLVDDGDEERRAKETLRRVGVSPAGVDFFRIPTDRVWMRDTGPIFVRDAAGKRIATCWRFNGWAKYRNHKKDELVAGRIARALELSEHRVVVGGRDVVLEGGAIEVDGEGTLLCTEECLLSEVQARNPQLTRRGIEQIFAGVLGVRRVVWLGRGIVGDDTHGHIDDLARFVAAGRVLLAQERNPKDENYGILEENRERLQAPGMELIPLPMPSPIIFEGMRVPASYANFYIANGVVMVPTFNDPRDRDALGLIAELFPDREVVGIHSVDLVWGLGTLHCAAQQEPAALRSDSPSRAREHRGMPDSLVKTVSSLTSESPRAESRGKPFDSSALRALPLRVIPPQ